MNWECANLAHLEVALMGYCARMMDATNQPNCVQTQPPIAYHLVIRVPRIYVLNPSTGANSPAVPPWIHGGILMV